MQHRGSLLGFTPYSGQYNGWRTDPEQSRKADDSSAHSGSGPAGDRCQRASMIKLDRNVKYRFGRKAWEHMVELCVGLPTVPVFTGMMGAVNGSPSRPVGRVADELYAAGIESELLQ
ncbi:hypothetical protein DFH09DRAFT_1075387 [Mycena vulgaris]|nr:hypothetical protein DFH09DRAFT_1075387 [Mycena vulgaris]